MNRFKWLCFILLIAFAGHAQNAPLAPLVTVALTPAILNQPMTIEVLVTNPLFSPVPTGQVNIDLGDGSPQVTLPISTTRAAATYTYTTLGQFTITASYSGDNNFAAASAAESIVIVQSAPAYMLHTFGDSLTGGLWNGTWPLRLLSDFSWPWWTWSNFANGGFKTNDEAPSIYNVVVDDTYFTTWLLGQNDGSFTSPMFDQFQHAVLAQNAWLAIPEGQAKVRAQRSAISQSGNWATSNIYPTTGLVSMTAGSELTATIPGNTIYVALTSLLTSDYTVDILIDGVDKGVESPVEAYDGNFTVGDPYGVRYVLGGSQSALHTVQIVCQNPGTSGCYVDWIGGNGASTRPNLPPYLFMGVSYQTLQDDSNKAFEARASIVRGVAGQLQADGLPVRVADIAALFNGPALPQCVQDGVHPNYECGNEIEETVWLSAMSFLATEAQRIDAISVTTNVGASVTLEAVSTSGLQPIYSVISGPGSLQGDTLTIQAAGTIVVEANQSGNATVLPAAPVQFMVTAAPASTSITLTADVSPQTAGSLVTLTAVVVPQQGAGVPKTGSVTFTDGPVVLGQANLGRNSVATFETSSLAVGTHTIAAIYSGDTNYLGSSGTWLEQIHRRHGKSRH